MGANSFPTTWFALVLLHTMFAQAASTTDFTKMGLFFMYTIWGFLLKRWQNRRRRGASYRGCEGVHRGRLGEELSKKHRNIKRNSILQIKLYMNTKKQIKMQITKLSRNLRIQPGKLVKRRFFTRHWLKRASLRFSFYLPSIFYIILYKK
jgi:hypothetical protein